MTHILVVSKSIYYQCKLLNNILSAKVQKIFRNLLSKEKKHLLLHLDIDKNIYNRNTNTYEY